jgi:hypothetical protein
MDGSVEQIADTVTTLVSTWGLRVPGAAVALAIGRMAARGVGRAIPLPQRDVHLHGDARGNA